LKYSELSARRHNPLLHRVCANCQTRMRLALIEPDEPGRDKLVFECKECSQEEFVVVRFNDSPRLLAPAVRDRVPRPEWIGMRRRTH
jgi:hypothetical protein